MCSARIKKGINISIVEKAVEAAKKAGMPYSVNFMIGNIRGIRERRKKKRGTCQKLDPFRLYQYRDPFPGDGIQENMRGKRLVIGSGHQFLPYSDKARVTDKRPYSGLK